LVIFETYRRKNVEELKNLNEAGEVQRGSPKVLSNLRSQDYGKR